jgi:hypothetical protein
MKKPGLVVLSVTIVAILLGWSIGAFFTERTVAKMVASIPASPIIVAAEYNKDKHAITYSILNPGGTELTVVQESFVFTPGKNSKEKGYIVSNIPVHVSLPPGVITAVELKLKAGTEKLQIGDAVLATFTYLHPLSPDLYTVVHPFKLGVKTGTETSKGNREVKKNE